MMGSIKKTLTSAVVSKYEGLVGNNTETFGWNFIMTKVLNTFIDTLNNHEKV